MKRRAKSLKFVIFGFCGGYFAPSLPLTASYQPRGNGKIILRLLRIRFDTLEFLPYTLWFVRGNFTQAVSASGVRRVQLEGSLLPEHCTTEWEQRAAGMGRQSRKAE